MVAWTAIATVAVTVYLMSGSAPLPALLITTVALATIYAVPMQPAEPPPDPPLTLIEGPAPFPPPARNTGPVDS
jgi:hypothetical protein